MERTPGGAGEGLEKVRKRGGERKDEECFKYRFAGLRPVCQCAEMREKSYLELYRLYRVREKNVTHF